MSECVRNYECPATINYHVRQSSVAFSSIPLYSLKIIQRQIIGEYFVVKIDPYFDNFINNRRRKRDKRRGIWYNFKLKTLTDGDNALPLMHLYYLNLCSAFPMHDG
jgi:hypothetical protein